MKLHDILKEFPGSQDGRITEVFAKDTQRELSDSLAEVAVKEGWAKLVTPKKSETDNVADTKALERAEQLQLLNTEIGVVEGKLEAAVDNEKDALTAELTGLTEKRDALVVTQDKASALVTQIAGLEAEHAAAAKAKKAGIKSRIADAVAELLKL